MNDKMEYLITSALIRVSEDSDFIHLYHDLVEEYERNLTRESDIVEGEKNGSPDTVTTGSDNEIFVDVIEQISENSNIHTTDHVTKATPSLGLRQRQRRVTAVSGEWYRRVRLHDFAWMDSESVNSDWIDHKPESKSSKKAAKPKDHFQVKGLQNNEAVNMGKKATKTQSQLNAIEECDIETCNELSKSSDSVRCNTCRKSFKTVQGLGAHMRTHLPHICLACGATFPKRAGLAHHQRVHSDRPHPCKLCGNSFKTLECLQLHKTSTHEFKCSQCDKTFERQSMLSWHITRTHNRSRSIRSRSNVTCEVCGRSFDSQSILNDHKNLHKGEKPYECKVCQKKFSLKSSLRGHNLIHVPESEHPYQCQLCSRGFRKERKLLSHVRFQHERKNISRKAPKQGKVLNYVVPIDMEATNSHESILTCEQCGKTCKTAQGLKFHEDKHLNPVVYECPTCGRILRSRSALKNHIESVHLDGRPHTCDTCGNSFKTLRSLRRHKDIHIGAKRFQCSYCDKTFLYRYHCKMHEATHDYSLRVVCDTCGLTFARRGDLNRHKKMHSMDAHPFKCKLCGKGFDRERKLRDHENEHTGSTPYECDVCTLKLSSWNSMRNHKKTHIPYSERPFQCQHCAKGWHYKGELLHHIKRSHPLAWQVVKRCGFMDMNELEKHCMGHVADKTVDNLRVNV